MMFKRRIGALAALLAVIAAPALGGVIDPRLEAIMSTARDNDVLSTLVYLDQQVDLAALDDTLTAERATRAERHELVVTSLRATAKQTQSALRDHLKQLEADGKIAGFQPLWIVNAFRVDATRAVIEDLARRGDVGTVYYNYEVTLIEPEEDPVSGTPTPAGQPRGSNPTPGLLAIKAPDVWALGYTGQGILVSSLDTGVDGNHPALASRWRGNDPAYAGNPGWAFFDPYSGWTFPQDSGSHGTHTMGTVCGGAPGQTIGVAPGAEWIHAAVIDRGGLSQTINDAVLAFQWLIDPDGNPATVWDVPHVCSNSWGIATWHSVPPWNNPCDPGFWSYLDACEAAGIVILFSAGNEGPSAETLRRPADRATDDYRTCAVGGIDPHDPTWPMYTSSSRGPTYCTPLGGAAIKPDINAPAVDVWSATPGNNYGNKTGTSMASPHVNGVVALMREACPDLTVNEIKQIMYDTALDLGPAGKDNDYGYGLVDAYESVILAEQMCGPSPPRVFDGYYEVPVNNTEIIALQAMDHDGGPNPIEFKIESLPTAGNTLTDMGNGHVITAGDLPYTLVNNGNEVEYAPANNFYGNDVFTFRATDGGTPPTGGDSELASVTVLVLYDAPTIVTTTLPDGCVGQSYAHQLQADQGQPQLNWDLITDQYVEVDAGASNFATTGTGQNWNADDNSWSYNLPFSFPYFGQFYTSVNVCSNGYLDFASSSADYSNSTSELIDNVRIAPLWDDWETDCSASNDIYIDETVPGQVTIRWDVEHYPCSSDGDFAITLLDDGTIKFHYGPTNNSLTPTIGISSGDGTNYVLASYDGATSLPSANSLEFVLPSPLPDGMTLQADGWITGTPTVAGTFAPRVVVTDALGRNDLAELSLTILPTCPYALGDLNCDGALNAADIDPFVLALTDPAGYAAAYPNCDRLLADCNGDGSVNAGDIDLFVGIIVP